MRAKTSLKQTDENGRTKAAHESIHTHCDGWMELRRAKQKLINFILCYTISSKFF
jgi:hypothetical protein